MAISTAASIGGGILGSASGGDSPSKGYWKPFREPIKDVGTGPGGMYDIWKANKGGTNPLMDAGLAGMGNIDQTLNPWVNYGQQMMTLGGNSAASMGQIGQQMAGWNPAMANASWQNGGAVGAQYNPMLAAMIMGQAPVDQTIAALTRDNWRNLNEGQMPANALKASLSGNNRGSKWGLNNAVMTRGTMDRNADVVASVMNNAYGLGVTTAGQYGLANADAANQMAQLNTTGMNDTALKLAQGNQQAYNEYGMAGLTGAADVYGNLMAQAAGYFTPSAQIASNIPQMQYQAGLNQRNAPMDWASAAMEGLRSGASPSVSGGGGQQQPSPWPAALGQVGDAAIDWWNSRTPKTK
jgi:hypothetical protein